MGVWVEAGGELADDLQYISAQLLQLRTMLTGDCTCGLEDENMRLKDLNETLQIQVGALQQRVSELEEGLADKENERAQADEILQKEKELHSVRQRLAELEESSGGCESACGALADQLRQARVSIEDQARELEEARRRCQQYEDAIKQLNEELEKANQIIEEGQSLRAQVPELQRALSESAAHTRALVGELAHAQQRYNSLENCCSEKAAAASSLRAALAEAQAQGAALCAAVRGVVTSVRSATAHMRARHRDQENKIKELEKLHLTRNKDGLVELSAPCYPDTVSLASKRTHSRETETAIRLPPSARESRDTRRKPSTSDGTCCECVKEKRRDYSSHVEYVSGRGSEMGICNCSFIMGERRKERAKSSRSKSMVRECPSQLGHDITTAYEYTSRVERRNPAQPKTSESEIDLYECSRVLGRKGDCSRSGSERASCSSAPTPPRRLLKKQFSAIDDKVKAWWCGGCDCAPRASHARAERIPREASPCAELEQRVSALQIALETMQSRWGRARTT